MGAVHVQCQRMGPGVSWLVMVIVTIITVTSHSQSVQENDEEDTRMSGMELSSYTCGDVTQSREFNFVSPGYPVSIGLDDLTCGLSIDHGCNGAGLSSSEDNSICQLRLDFDEFNVQPPLL